MKRYFILPLLAALVLSLASCEKDDPVTPDAPLKPDVENPDLTYSPTVSIYPDGTTSTGTPFKWMPDTDNSEFFLGYVRYKIDFSKSQLTVTGVDEYGLSAILKGSIKLPHTVIINDNTFHLNSIGREAFFGCNELKKIDIPYGVSVIERSAFAKCTNLRACSNLIQ